MKTPTVPREMRKIIHECAYQGSRVDGKESARSTIPVAGTLAKAILSFGQANGWSGEDIMTVLAYQALLAYERVTDNLIEQARLSPSPSPFFGAPNPSARQTQHPLTGEQWKKIGDAISESLHNYRCRAWQTEDGGMPLYDLLIGGRQGTIKGEDADFELEMLCDHIFNDLRDHSTGKS